MARRAGETVAVGPGYDPLRVQAKVKAALDETPQGRVVRTAVQAFRQGMREHDEAIAFGERMGSSAPPREQTLRRPFRWVCVAPEGDKAYAWACQFEGNSTLERLKRAGRIESNHVSAASTFVAIYTCAIDMPRVTASYQGGGGGARGPAEWLSRSADAREALNELRADMAKEEFEIVRDIAVFDEAVAVVAALRKPGWQRAAAEGYVVGRLVGGLERMIRAD